MSNVQHVAVFQGVNQTLALKARDDANNIAPLSGKTVSWYVGDDPAFPLEHKALITKTGTVTGPANGTFTIALLPEDTANLEGDYRHMAKTTDGAGNIAVVCEGRFRVRSVIVP